MSVRNNGHHICERFFVRSSGLSDVLRFPVIVWHIFCGTTKQICYSLLKLHNRKTDNVEWYWYEGWVDVFKWSIIVGILSYKSCLSPWRWYQNTELSYDCTISAKAAFGLLFFFLWLYLNETLCTFHIYRTWGEVVYFIVRFEKSSFSETYFMIEQGPPRRPISQPLGHRLKAKACIAGKNDVSSMCSILFSWTSHSHELSLKINKNNNKIVRRFVKSAKWMLMLG